MEKTLLPLMEMVKTGTAPAAPSPFLFFYANPGPRPHTQVEDSVGR